MCLYGVLSRNSATLHLNCLTNVYKKKSQNFTWTSTLACATTAPVMTWPATSGRCHRSSNYGPKCRPDGFGSNSSGAAFSSAQPICGLLVVLFHDPRPSLTSFVYHKVSEVVAKTTVENASGGISRLENGLSEDRRILPTYLWQQSVYAG